jgi:signal peptidase I
VFKGRRRRRAAHALLLALAGAWWTLLAPTSLGGPTGFIVVDGSSMEPRYMTGDLVITRTADAYAPGDIIAFHYGGGRVIHQIVGGSARQGWTTQGINKPAPDAWTIPDRDVIGKQWVDVPNALPWLSWTRTPVGMALLVTAAALFVALPTSSRRRRPSPALKEILAMNDAPADDASAWRPSVPSPIERAGLNTAIGVGSGGAFLLGIASLFVDEDGRLLLLNVDAGVARTAAVVMIVLAVLAALPLGARVHLAWRGSKLEKVVARLRPKLMRVASLPADLTTVQMTAPAQLLTIAKQERVPVLHHVDDATHRFVVATAGANYELRMLEVVPPGEPARTQDDLPAEPVAASSPAAHPSDDSGPAVGTSATVDEPAERERRAATPSAVACEAATAADAAAEAERRRAARRAAAQKGAARRAAARAAREAAAAAVAPAPEAATRQAPAVDAGRVKSGPGGTPPTEVAADQAPVEAVPHKTTGGALAAPRDVEHPAHLIRQEPNGSAPTTGGDSGDVTPGRTAADLVAVR